MTYIKSSPSLSGIHLSNNPGISAESKKRYLAILEIEDMNDLLEHMNEMTFILPTQPNHSVEVLSSQNRETVQIRKINK